MSDLGINVVSYEFIETLQQGLDVHHSIKNTLLSTWGDDDCQELKPDDPKLPKEVKDLLCFLSTIEDLKKIMIEYEIDLIKMPLGKVCKTLIAKCFKLLGKAQQIIIKGCNKAEITAISDEFFEIIPHTYEKGKHPLLDNEDIIKAFKINRHAESANYAKFKEYPNKKLLFHGSRLDNFVGILTNGLLISPPEAAKNGNLFGRGVYFSDIVSGSAAFCFAEQRAPVGLLLLCEVALGRMFEKTDIEYVAELPANYHSTLALGLNIPDPTDKCFIKTVEVPYGKPVQRMNFSSSDVILYNEYVVYNTDQINMKYLLKVKFEF